MWSSTQIPHILRLMLAMITGMPEHKLRVIAPDVGGGFGGKLQVTPEEVLALLVAKRARQAGQVDRDPQRVADERPPRPRPDPVHRHRRRPRGQHQGPEGAASSPTWAPTCGWSARACRCWAPSCTPAIYKFPAYRFDCQGIFTNKVPTDAYRGAGRPEATFAIERIMDELAVELDMDPLELRRKNWIKAEEFPFTTVAGLEYDSGDYEQATQQALELLGYDELREEQRRRRESNDPVQLGIGFSTFTEMCGLAPSRVLGSLSYGAGGWEHASIRMLPTGKVEVVTGSTPHGQGHETAWSQLVADELGVPFEDVEVLHGDTAISSRGLDTYGSRSLVVGGAAVVKAAREGGRQGPQGRRAPAGGERGRPRLRRRHVLGPRHARHRASPSRRSRWPRSRRTTSRRASSRRSTPTRPSTRSTSPSPTARTSAPWRSTPRPAW